MKLKWGVCVKFFILPINNNSSSIINSFLFVFISFSLFSLLIDFLLYKEAEIRASFWVNSIKSVVSIWNGSNILIKDAHFPSGQKGCENSSI